MYATMDGFALVKQNHSFQEKQTIYLTPLEKRGKQWQQCFYRKCIDTP